MPVQVLIVSTRSHFPAFTREGLKEILAVHPKLFGEPHLESAFGDIPRRHSDLEVEFSDCLVEAGKVYFLHTKTEEFRKCPWVIEKFQSGALAGLLRVPPGAELGLKVVEIPDGVQWYLHTYQDGVEAVHEQGRVWA